MRPTTKHFALVLKKSGGREVALGHGVILNVAVFQAE
jgi:hypothetical protein